jgi:hypothetical protein
VDLTRTIATLETELAVARERVVHLAAELADERERGVRRDAEQAAQLLQRDEQLAAARAAADKATAELVALAQRLAAIAEGQASSRDDVRPEPPRRHSRLGRAWSWFLRN